MIVSRTPLRISLAGGGSDLPQFYQQSAGAVVSFTIDKSVYIACHSLYSGGIRLNYSRSEFVHTAADIKHPLIRESILELGFNGDLEVGSFADVPALGTGLGSSSSFTVGFLNALGHHIGREMSPFELAELACRVEITRCGEPIGKQDQFAAAFGGINVFDFLVDGSVMTRSIYSVETATFLESVLMLFDLGYGRRAKDILFEQGEAMKHIDSFAKVMEIRSMVDPMVSSILSHDFLQLASLLNDSWRQKSNLAKGISTAEIDSTIEFARKCGALGGKVVGAGGGGFLLLVVEPEKKEQFRRDFTILRELHFSVSKEGSRIVYSGANEGVMR